MRFIFGVIFGICLTVGATYVADTVVSAPGSDQAASRHMVNWDVVDGNLRGASADVKDAWAKLLGKAKEIDRKTGI